MLRCFVRKNGQPSEDFATRANSGAALERITPASARIYEILHHPEAFTVQTIAAAEHIKGRHHAEVVDQGASPSSEPEIAGQKDRGAMRGCRYTEHG
jgi:hypothetical protein